jgi:O-antigen/teichoic acid export membrane protein
VASLGTWITRGSILSVAPIVEYGSRFVRTALLSRLLGPHEFGISMAIATMLAVAALITDLSLDKFVVISTGSDDRTHSLGAVHVLSIARGLVLSGILFITASTTARIFGVPDSAGSFAVAAFCPLFASFAHLNIKQIQQRFQFASEMIAQVVTQLSALAAATIGALVFRDHRAMLASFLTEAVVYTIASHVLSHTRYGLSSSRAILQRAAIFALPLMVNGIGLAALSQLDRMLVGAWLGVQVLGYYAVMLALSVYPTSLIFRVFGTIGISSLLQHRETESFGENYALLMFFSSVISVTYSLLVALSLDWLLPTVFGPSFHVNQCEHLLIVAIVYFRLMRGTAPTMYYLVTQKTGELALLNLMSGVGIAIAFWLLHYRSSLDSVLFGLLVGEFLALVVVIYMSSVRSVGPRNLWHTDFLMSLISLTIILGALVWMPEPTWEARSVISLLGLSGIAAELAIGFYTQRSFGLSFQRPVR